MHAAAGNGDWFDERCVMPSNTTTNSNHPTKNRFVFANGLAHDACRLFAAETSSLYKWKKRCSKQSWYGDAPLHLAVLNEHIDVAKYLLKVSTVHTTTINPCILSITLTPLTSSPSLSQSGADINEFNTMGWSPLHCAASAGNAEMVRLLLQVTNAHRSHAHTCRPAARVTQLESSKLSHAPLASTGPTLPPSTTSAK